MHRRRHRRRADDGLGVAVAAKGVVVERERVAGSKERLVENPEAGRRPAERSALDGDAVQSRRERAGERHPERAMLGRLEIDRLCPARQSVGVDGDRARRGPRLGRARAMDAQNHRRPLAIVEAAKGGIDAEVHRRPRGLLDQPDPLFVGRRRQREPEHPAAAGKCAAQAVDGIGRRRERKARIVPVAVRVHERTQERVACAGRARLGREVAGFRKPRLERGDPRTGRERPRRRGAGRRGPGAGAAGCRARQTPAASMARRPRAAVRRRRRGTSGPRPIRQRETPTHGATRGSSPAAAPRSVRRRSPSRARPAPRAVERHRRRGSPARRT